MREKTGKNSYCNSQKNPRIPRAVDILFPHTKGCGNAIHIRNEKISPCNFSINP